MSNHDTCRIAVPKNLKLKDAKMLSKAKGSRRVYSVLCGFITTINISHCK